VLILLDICRTLDFKIICQAHIACKLLKAYTIAEKLDNGSSLIQVGKGMRSLF
jgi:hypothetical protein